MKKIPKQGYTAEFKEQAVKRAQEVNPAVAAREPGLVGQTLRNWVKAATAYVSHRRMQAGMTTRACAKPYGGRATRLRRAGVTGVTLAAIPPLRLHANKVLPRVVGCRSFHPPLKLASEADRKAFRFQPTER